MKSLLVFLFTSLCLLAASPPRDTAKTGMDPDRLAKIPARMKSFVDKGTIAGCVTLVARHGAIASLEAVGYTDLDHKTPMRTDAIFQIHSMTKPVTAAGIMLLMEEGKLALSDSRLAVKGRPGVGHTGEPTLGVTAGVRPVAGGAPPRSGGPERRPRGVRGAGGHLL